MPGCLRLLGVVAAAAGTALLTPFPALATTRALPFSYPYETLPRGKVEVEQYTDLVPMRVARERPDGTQEGVFTFRSVLQSEIEYGLTDRAELAFYFVFQQNASPDAPALQFHGLKQRLRLRLSEAGQWPVNVGLYFEVAEFHDEIEFEQKLLLSRRLGRVNLIANLWVEQEFYFQTSERKFVYNPTAGATFEVSPRFIVGAEYWGRGRFDSSAPRTLPGGSTDAPPTTRHYLGPTAMVQAREIWLSVGAYLRLDGIRNGFEVGEPFGRVWVRALIGVGF